MVDEKVGKKIVTSSENPREAKIEDYEKFFALSQDMFCIAGLDGYFRKVNPSFERVLGYTEKELLERSFMEFIYPDDLKKTEAELVKLDQGQPTIHFENRYKCSDGSYKWLSWTSTPSSQNGLLYAVARDITKRKNIEEEHRKNQAFLDSIVENIPNMVFVKDAESLNFVSLNKAGEQLLGFSREDLVGKNDYDFFPKEEADFFKEKDMEVLKGKKMLDIQEEDILTKNNGKRHLHTKKIPLYDKDGNPEYLLGISEDITEAKYAQEALRESEEKYRTLAESALDAIIICDESGKIRSWNRGAELIFGYKENEIVGDTLSKLMPERYRKKHQKGFKQYLTTGKPTGIGNILELEGIRKGGEVFPLELSLSSWETSRGVFFSGIIRDTTEAKRAGEALQQSEKKYKDIVHLIQEGIWVIDAQNKTTFVNEEMAKILGYDVAEMIGKHLYDFMDVEAKTLSESNSERRKNGISEKHDFKFITKDGAEKWTILNTRPILNEKGKYVGAIAAVIDVTERKLAEAKIMKALVQGQDMERKRIAEDLHDSLGQKLSAIKLNYSGMHETSNELGSEASEEIENLKDLLNEAIEEVRYISHNLMPSTLEAFGLKNAVSELCGKITKSGKVNVSFQKHGKTASLDKETEMGVYRIVQELVNNGLKHSKATELSVQLFYRDNVLIVSAEDDGIGFNYDKADQENTFGINSISSRTKALGGTFVLESQPGKGTLAQIEIPT